MGDIQPPAYSGISRKTDKAIPSIREATRILAIIVLYKVSPGESRSLKSLMASLDHVAGEDLQLKVLLCDNTPGGHDPGALPGNAEYRVAPGNYGLASAYNMALRMAELEGYDWLLTLDQDTEVPDIFLGRVAAIAEELKENIAIAAIVPKVLDNEVLVSPHVVLCGRSKQLPKNFAGISNWEIEAINSGTAWRVNAVKELGGFNLLFWLDYLDYWLCHMIHRSGKRIYVAGDVLVAHELSVLDLDKRMSPARFDNFLQAESAFCDMYKSALDGLILTARLVARLGRQTIRGEDARFRRLTLMCFKRRVMQTARTRIENWRQEMSTHMPA